MRIEPELRQHPKFLRLKKLIGDQAMECLVAIWGHCQCNQRGEFWPGADADYVEMVCGWDGQAGVLFNALVTCGKPGFLLTEPDGVRVHDWAEMNSQMVANWRKNPNGRAGKNQTGSNRKPTANPVVNPVLPLSAGGRAPAEKPEPTANPVVNHMGKQTGSNGEPTALSFFLNSHSGKGNGETVDLSYVGAQACLTLLNELTGSKFNPPIMELDQIVARLQETGNDVAGVQQMLRRQVALWSPSAKMRPCLKPGTLFGPNFHDYYGQRAQPVEVESADRFKKPGPDRSELLQQLAAARNQLAALDTGDPAWATWQQRTEALEAQIA